MNNARIVRRLWKMIRIDGIKFNISDRNPYLYTKRTCTDNSELYIGSKLNRLYEQAFASKNQFNSKRNLRKLVEGNHLDETV